VKPRIRILLATLALALLVAPAQASAAPSFCGAGLGPFATTGIDTTAPSSAWQKGSPVGTVDIPLTGTGVDGFEWKVNCGTVTPVSGAGTASIVGDGIYRFTHRAQETGTGIWTDWVDHWVQIDSTAPTNTTVPPSTAWRGSAANIPVTAAADSGSPVHTEWRIGNSGPWTSDGSALVDGTGTYSLQTAAVDAAGNRDERTDVIKIDKTLPVDTTVTPSPGWHDGAVNVDVLGTDAHSGVDHVEWQIDGQLPVGSGPAGTTVSITTHGQHIFKTRVIDAVGNASAWVPRDVWVDIQGPTDTTVVPTTWFTTPSTIINVTADDNGASGIKKIQWRLDTNTTGQVLGTDTVPVNVSGDGVHKLEVRITDNQDRVLEWQSHDVKIDTVTPTDTTDVATGWLPYSTLNVNVRGTDAHSAIQRVEWRIDGGNIDSFAGSSHDVAVTGQGPHTFETRVVDNAGLASGWSSHPIKLDSSLPTNTSPTVPAGWRNTPYSVVLNGTDSGSGVASVGWKLQLEGDIESAEQLGTKGVETVTISADGTHTLNTRLHDVAGNASGWRPETIKIDTVNPTDSTVYPSAPVGNRHLITFAPADDRSGVAGIEWKLDNGIVKTAASVNVIGEGDHTLSVRVKDNAGNWSAWGDHTVTVNLALDTTAPTDTTVVPTLWRTSAYAVTVKADDDIDGQGVDFVEWRYDDHATESGPSGSQVAVTTDGVHEFETRATDKAGNVSDWRPQQLKIDTVKPVDTTVMPTGWTNTRTFSLNATDATSGVANLEYKLGNASPVTVANGASVTLPGDGTYTISHRANDVAGQSSGWKTDTYKVETVLPVNTSAAAPTGWISSLSLPLTGTDLGGSTYDHGEWRADGGDVQTGATAVVETEGTLTLETRVADKAGNVSLWRPETIKIDRTKPVNTTPLAGAAWRKTNYAVTVTGTDATPGSGMQRIEYKLDGAAALTTPSVSITTEGNHTLVTRSVDLAGNVSDWRTDTIGIDKTAPTLAVDCGTSAWRNTAANCAVSASGGLSGLPTLTGAVGSGAAAPIAGGAFAVGAEGASTISFRAVDGAGNETTTSAAVKIDTVAPAAAVKCAPSGASAWVCTASGSDALSGLASLAWSVDGSAPVAIGSDGTFVAQKGSAVVYAADAAGNMAASAPVTLADRTPAPEVTEQPTPRTTSEAVLLRKGGGSSARLLGQLSLSSLPSSTTVDLRPLALGKGTFQFVIKVTTGKKSKTVSKTQTTKSGYSQRISVRVAAAEKASVTLTVRKRSGSRWATYATGTAKL
jgi:hypothetical protein